MGKTKDLAVLKQANLFTVTVFEGRLAMTFEPNSLLNRATANTIAEDLRKQLKTDPAYANGIFDQVEQFVDFFSLFCVTFTGCEWKPQGDEQAGLLWLISKLEVWETLTVGERWQVRMESELDHWEEIAGGFFGQRIVNIPIESRPAELLTDEEQAEARDPKVASIKSDGDGNAPS